MTTDTALQQIRSMTNRELVAFWNVLQFSARMGNRDTFKESLVSLVMEERELPHELGKRTILA